MANKLKLITAKAKKLYATGKYKKWTDAIKQASKSLGAVKIIQKGESKKTKTSKTLMQKRDKKGHFKGYSVVSGVKKTAKKKTAKKKTAKSYHKDTKSHNVRISVMSGLNDYWIKELNNFIKLLKSNQRDYEILKSGYNDKTRNKEFRKKDFELMKKVKKQISYIKKHISTIKRNIK